VQHSRLAPTWSGWGHNPKASASLACPVPMGADIGGRLSVGQAVLFCLGRLFRSLPCLQLFEPLLCIRNKFSQSAFSPSILHVAQDGPKPQNPVKEPRVFVLEVHSGPIGSPGQIRSSPAHQSACPPVRNPMGVNLWEAWCDQCNKTAIDPPKP
jgi:hypothetical protein